MVEVLRSELWWHRWHHVLERLLGSLSILLHVLTHHGFHGFQRSVYVPEQLKDFGMDRYSVSLLAMLRLRFPGFLAFFVFFGSVVIARLFAAIIVVVPVFH